MVKFFGTLILICVVIVPGYHLGLQQGWIVNKPSFFYESLIFLVFTIGVIFVYLYRIKKPTFFIQLYLLTMAVKFLGYGAYCLFMILEDQTGAFLNVSFFMAVYLIFTAVEIGFLYRKISGESGS